MAESQAKESRRKGPTASEVAAGAARELTELTGYELEGVVGVDRSDDGWKVRLEIVELHRIPQSTDLLAVYEVDMDADAEMGGFRRVHRYYRGQPGED